ncbi:ribonuclease H-like domain-containing protein [Absidia repens]|uniref:Ribonuclease H-like domain-containing protein n=1 Tax=Absidia repens TaxID=90262 RepID=A0A1X2IF28_9FUNG|nr:ribonuclease H-like domain-containing protein [Absidia repens]
MEIPRQDFTQKLPMVKAAIDECDFMAIDTELSGLHRPGTGKRIETRDYRYNEYKEATDRFLIIQFGLCTFKWDAPSGRYIAKPFNFNIFPTSFAGGRSQPNRVFSVQAQAFDFLAKQAFDFNKWIYQGIPYMNLDDEKKFVTEKRKMLNDEMPDIPVDDKDRPFLEDARKKINTWLESKNNKPKDNEGINIAATNGYLRRLIYQEVRNNFEGLTAEGRQGYIRVIRFSKEQQLKRNKEREEQFENDRDKAIGFRKVIDWISESKKPLVGHNMLLDMCHVIGQFIQPLPDTKEEFKTLATKLFPIMIDTKHIAISAPEIEKIVTGATDLENLRFETSRQAFENPRVDMDWEFPRYIEQKAHEAGYDAYMTGTAFIKMVSYLDSQRNPEEIVHVVEDAAVELEKEIQQEETITESNGGWDIEPDDDVDPNWTIDDDEIYNYGSTWVRLLEENGAPIPLIASIANKAALVRSAYHYFDFAQEEQGIIKQSNTFVVHLNQQALLENDVALKVLSAIGQYIVEPMDENSSLVVYERALADKDTIKQRLIDELKKNTASYIPVDSIIDYRK